MTTIPKAQRLIAMITFFGLFLVGVIGVLSPTQSFAHSGNSLPILQLTIDTPDKTTPSSGEKTTLTLNFAPYDLGSGFDVRNCKCEVSLYHADKPQAIQSLTLKPVSALKAETTATFKSSGSYILTVKGEHTAGTEFESFEKSSSIEVLSGSTNGSELAATNSVGPASVLQILAVIFILGSLGIIGIKLFLIRRTATRSKNIPHIFSRTFARSRMTMAALGFGIAGSAMLIVAQAATPFSSLEPENGTASGGASVQTDATASGGKAVLFAASSPTPAPTPTMTATINAGTKYQTIQALGTSINAAQWNNGEARAAIDMLIDGGVKQWRVVLDEPRWEATNDNTDPNVYNDTYFNSVLSSAKVEELWSTIAYLNSKGFSGYDVTLAFMGRGPTWMTNDSGRTVDSASEENEWAEMVAATVNYGRKTKNLDFKRLQPNNESDWGGVIEGILMSSGTMASSYAKVSQRLDTMGLSDIRFVGPDTADIGAGVSSYIPALKNNAAVNAKMDTYWLHSYGASTGGASSAVAGTNKTFWMSEFSLIDDIFPLLDQGSSGFLMWDGYDSVYEHAIANGLGSTPPNDSFSQWLPLLKYNSTAKTYSPRKAFYLFKQFYKYIPHGAQRVATSSSRSDVTMRGFVDPATGNVTVIGDNNASSQQVIEVSTQSLTQPPVLRYYDTRYADHNNTSDTWNFKQSADAVKINNKYYITVPAGMFFTFTSMP